MGCSLFKRWQSLQALSLGSFSVRVLPGKEAMRGGEGSWGREGWRRQLAAGGLDATSEQLGFGMLADDILLPLLSLEPMTPRKFCGQNK